jgi:hypothetical protein
VSGFEIEFFNAAAAQDDHPGFLRVRRIDEHLIGHRTVSLRRVDGQPPVRGGANKDEPDRLRKGRVTGPRLDAMQPGRRSLEQLRACRTLKFASGMTSTRLEGGGATRHRSLSPAVRAAMRYPAQPLIRMSSTRASARPATAPRREKGRS